MAKIIDEVGNLKIKRRERFQSGSPNGMRPGWTEYQMWEGRKIISRHDTYEQARNAAHAYHKAMWDEISATVYRIAERAAHRLAA